MFKLKILRNVIELLKSETSVNVLDFSLKSAFLGSRFKKTVHYLLPIIFTWIKILLINSEVKSIIQHRTQHQRLI